MAKEHGSFEAEQLPETWNIDCTVYKKGRVAQRVYSWTGHHEMRSVSSRRPQVLHKQFLVLLISDRL